MGLALCRNCREIEPQDSGSSQILCALGRGWILAVSWMALKELWWEGAEGCLLWAPPGTFTHLPVGQGPKLGLPRQQNRHFLIFNLLSPHPSQLDPDTTAHIPPPSALGWGENKTAEHAANDGIYSYQ